MRRNRATRVLTGPLTIARALCQRPAVLYVVCLDLLPWAVAARLVGRCGVVYDSNDEYDTIMLMKTWLPVPVRRPIGAFVRRLEPWLASHLDAATTALPPTQAKFERAGVRSVLVRNFPPTNLAADAGSQADVDILVSGTIEHDQLSLLAQTAVELEQRGKARRWLIAARDFTPANRAHLESILADHGLRDGFELLFDVPFREMQQLMSRARVGFILYGAGPAYASRLPMRIFEYMAAGLPFVAADLPGAASVIDEDAGVLARAGDPVAYAAALNDLLEDPLRRQRMSESGPELVRSRFNWERESAKLIELFERLVGQP